MSTVEVEELKRKINHVADQNQRLDDKIDRVLFHLNDDPQTGTPGLVQKVRNQEKELVNLNADFAKYKQDNAIEKAVRKATIATWATISGFVGGGALWLFKIFLTYFLSKIA